MTQVLQTDYLIVGSGLAGLSLGARLSESGRVAIVTKSDLGYGNSRLAQGGMAAALSPDDSPRLHAEDTLQTAQGLGDVRVTEAIVNGSLDAVRFLQRLNVPFDREENGTLALGKEGAHSRNRIVHSGGDATGRSMIRSLVKRVQTEPNILVFEHTAVSKLLLQDGRCRGAAVKDISRPNGEVLILRANAVVLATGGMGQIFRYSTNAPGMIGEGYALAYEAGAVLRDMEFIQFHPTALKTPGRPTQRRLSLISEAVRGEGAFLVNAEGRRFMQDVHPWGDLASRDIVARAIYEQMEAGQTVYLDARPVENFAERFPTIFASCMENEIDPRREPIPVVPAAHYAMGGIQTDDRGRTTVPGLYAVGEAASTGFHGANRLASNSLLEAVVMAFRTAEALTSALEWEREPSGKASFFAGFDTPNAKLIPDSELLHRVQTLMWKACGIVRNGRDLTKARDELEKLASGEPAHLLANRRLLTTARLVVSAALWRQESRGGHYRSDYPQPVPLYQKHSQQGGRHESVIHA